ncbi:MAG: hypothetical protein IKE55_12335 [Kiritimatiellae bacterium]|nr:hypothetical protein [Kiritimatiellia bacterium]
MTGSSPEIYGRLDWRGRIVRNAWPLFVRMVLSSLASLLAVRIALAALGVSGYGVFVAVNAVVVLFMTFNGVLQVTAQRFLSHAMWRANDESLSVAYSLILGLALFFVGLIVVVGEPVGMWAVRNRLSLPAGSVRTATLVFHSCLAVAVMNTLQLPFAALIVAGERMVFFAWLSIVEAAVAIGAPAVALLLPGAGLPVYAGALAAGSAVVLAMQVLYCRRKFPSVRFVPRFPPRKLYETVSFFSWGTMSSVGNLLKYQGVSLLMNIYAGVVFNASWEVAMSTGAIVFVGSGCLQTAYSPVVYKDWQNPDKEPFGRLVGNMTLVSFLLSAVPGGVVFAFAPAILRTWLGAELPPQAVAFVRCAAVNMIVDAISAPLTTAILATGRVALYQTLAFSMSASSFLLSWALLCAGCQAWTAMCAVAAFNGLAAFYRLIHVRFVIGVKVRLAPIRASCPWRRRNAGGTGATGGRAT